MMNDGRPDAGGSDPEPPDGNGSNPAPVEAGNGGEGTPNVEATGDNPANVEATGDNPANVEATGDNPANVEATGETAPEATAPGPQSPDDGRPDAAPAPSETTEGTSDRPRGDSGPPDASGLPPISRLVLGSCLLFLSGAFPTFGAWALKNWEKLPIIVTTNELPKLEREQLVAIMAGVGLLAIAAALFTRPWRDGASRFYVWAQRAAPLAALGLMPPMFCYEAWTGRELRFLAVVSVGLFFFAGLMRLALRTLPDRLWTVDLWPSYARRVVQSRWLPLGIVCVASAYYTLFFSSFALRNHYHLWTRTFDLAVENNLIWQAAHGGPLFHTSSFGGTQSHMGWHQSYFTYVLAQFYRFYPHPEFLLVFQSLILGATAIPLYLLSERRIGRLPAAALSALWIFYAPWHGANLYDFHYQSVMGFLLLFMLYFIETRRTVLSIVFLLLALSLREDMGLLVAAIGIYLIARGERPWVGVGIIALSMVHFGIFKLVIMPRYLKGVQAYVHQYMALIPKGQENFPAVLQTIFGNVLYTLTTLFEERKLLYALQIFGPLAFLPLRRPLAYALLAPGIFFTLMSSYDPLLMLTFQYTLYWCLVFLAASVALERVGQWGQPRVELTVWLSAMAFAGLAISHQSGVLFHQKGARGGFFPMHYDHTPEDIKRHEDLYALIRQIPKDDPVLCSDWLVSHVSSRDIAYSLQTEVNHYEAKYLLFERTRLAQIERERIGALLKEGRFGVVERRGDFVLAKQGHPPTLNEHTRREWHLP